MRFRNRIVLLFVPVALVLAGCFQQAGTALQEPIETNQAVVAPPSTSAATSIPLPTETDNSTGNTDNGQGQPLSTPTFNTLPDTTLSTETTTTDDGNPPVALTIISATLPPLDTETPASAPTEANGQIVQGGGTPSDGQFITPSGPLGPITQVPNIGVTNNAGEPTATPSGLVTPTAFSQIDTAGNCTHTVQSGDTLYRIGLKYEVTVAQIREANPQVQGDIIQPGDVLNIPNCNPGGGTGTNVTQPTTAPEVPPTPLPGGSQTYVVKRGDTLYTIGLKFGVTADAIQKANNISNPNRITPGQELIIPPKSG